jgi:hypothetical protein
MGNIETVKRMYALFAEKDNDAIRLLFGIKRKSWGIQKFDRFA